MDNTVEKVGLGIRETLRRLQDTRARLAAHRSALDKRRLELVRVIAPPLLLDASSTTSQLSFSISRDAAGTFSSALSKDVFCATTNGDGSTLCGGAAKCMEGQAGGMKDTIVIAPAAASMVAMSATQDRASVAASAEASSPALKSPSPMFSALAPSGTPTCADFYSVMMTRTQKLVEQRSNYCRMHLLHAAKLRIAQTWVREVLPWFETAVYRDFFQEVIHRIDALDQRLSRLCRRFTLDRSQYILTCSCTTPRGWNTEASGDLANEGRRCHLHARCTQQSSTLLYGEGSRRQIKQSGGVSNEVLPGRNDGESRKSVQPHGLTEQAMYPSLPLGLQGSESVMVADHIRYEGDYHSVCALWHTYIQTVSQTDAPTDDLLHGDEQADNVPPLTHGSITTLLRTPRSLRHVWHVLLKGLTGSCLGAVDEATPAKFSSVFSSTDAPVQHLSDLTRRHVRGLMPSASLSSLSQCNQSDQVHPLGNQGSFDTGPNDDDCSDASGIVLVRLPADTVSSLVDPISSQICALACCVIHLASLAKQCSGIRAGKASFSAAPLPQLVYTGKACGGAEEGAMKHDDIGDLEMVRRCSGMPVTGLPRAPGRRSLCQSAVEGQLVDALAAVYHALPCLLAQLRLRFRGPKRGHGNGSSGPQKHECEPKVAIDGGGIGQHSCASPTTWGCHRVAFHAMDTDAAAAAAPWSTVGDAARDLHAYGQWWSSLVLSLLTMDSSPQGAPLSRVPVFFVRALRVGSLFHNLVNDFENKCGDGRPPFAVDAAPAMQFPATGSPLVTAQGNPFTVTTDESDSAQLVSAVPHRASPFYSTSSPPLAASALLSSLRQVEMETRQQWQSMETRLSIARSMADAALNRAAHGDSAEEGCVCVCVAD